MPIFLAPKASVDIPYGLRQLHSVTVQSGGVKEIGDNIRHLLERLKVHAKSENADLPASARAIGLKTIPQTAVLKCIGKDGLIDLLHHLRQTEGKYQNLVLALIDIDNQTGINHRFGGDAGDQIIAIVYEILRVRTAGMPFGRFGDDSFYVVFDSVNLTDVQERMEKVRTQVQFYNWKHIATDLYVTCSVGIAERMLGEDASRWASRAGEGVKLAKAAGGNRIQVGPHFIRLDFVGFDFS